MSEFKNEKIVRDREIEFKLDYHYLKNSLLNQKCTSCRCFKEKKRISNGNDMI
jgi:hypothetical protein